MIVLEFWWGDILFRAGYIASIKISSIRTSTDRIAANTSAVSSGTPVDGGVKVTDDARSTSTTLHMSSSLRSSNPQKAHQLTVSGVEVAPNSSTI